MSTIELPSIKSNHPIEDIEFSENLIREIDSTWINKKINLKISDENIITCNNDTIQFTIYDIINNDNDIDFSKEFDFFEVFIEIFKMPVKCLIINFKESHCAVCKKGIIFEENFDNKKLIEYIENGVQQRLER